MTKKWFSHYSSLVYLKMQGYILCISIPPRSIFPRATIDAVGGVKRVYCPKRGIFEVNYSVFHLILSFFIPLFFHFSRAAISDYPLPISTTITVFCITYTPISRNCDKYPYYRQPRMIAKLNRLGVRLICLLDAAGFPGPPAAGRPHLSLRHGPLQANKQLHSILIQYSQE